MTTTATPTAAVSPAKRAASADIGDPLLLAWTQPDEPDGIYSQVPWETIQSTYNNWKTIDPNRNVLINFVGAYCPSINTLCQYDVRNNQGGIDWYKKYVAGADWISADTYPANSGDPVTKIGEMVRALRAMSGTKPVFAYIESGDFDTTNSFGAPTPDEFRAEVWSAIINGARGIWYFVVKVAPTFEWDVTPTAVATEMTKQNATITQLAPVLQGTINPTSIGATVPSPLEVGWRDAPSGKYFMVVNPTNTTRNSQAITVTGTGSAINATVYGESRTTPISGGKITDSFAPYAVHIYQVSP